MQGQCCLNGVGAMLSGISLPGNQMNLWKKNNEKGMQNFLSL